MQDKQQLISTISTSSLRSGRALLENNLAPRLESKTESPKVQCFHAIFDLCLVFGWTLGHVPSSLSLSLFSPSLFLLPPISISFLFLHLFVFFPLLLFPSICLPGFFVFLSAQGLSGKENAPHTCTKPQTKHCIWEGVWNRNYLPSLHLCLFFLCFGVRGYHPTISQPINPSDRTILIVSHIVAFWNNKSHTVIVWYSHINYVFSVAATQQDVMMWKEILKWLLSKYDR